MLPANAGRYKRVVDNFLCLRGGAVDVLHQITDRPEMVDDPI